MHGSKGRLLLGMCSRPAPLVNKLNNYSTRIQMSNLHFVVVDREGRPQKRRNEIFGPANPRYPLPGDVMFAAQYQRHNQFLEGRELEQLAEELNIDSDDERGQKSDEGMKIDRRTPSMSVQDALERLLAPTSRSDSYVPPPLSTCTSTSTNPATNSPRSDAMPMSTTVEMHAHQCPSLLRLEMRQLFPGTEPLMARDLVMLNLQHSAKFHDGDNGPEAEAQRLQLAFSFVDAASAICESLHCSGYWADFLDPRSGKPYYNREATRRPFEHDERYQQLGYQLSPNGSCNVLRNVRWKEDERFVGTIFTDAPMRSSVVKNLLKEINRKGGSPGV